MLHGVFSEKNACLKSLLTPFFGSKPSGPGKLLRFLTGGVLPPEFLRIPCGKRFSDICDSYKLTESKGCAIRFSYIYMMKIKAILSIAEKTFASILVKFCYVDPWWLILLPIHWTDKAPLFVPHLTGIDEPWLFLHITYFSQTEDVGSKTIRPTKPQ